MSKRKFSESVAAEAPSNAISPKALRLQRLQLDGLIDQGKTSLFRALRVARGIERQKLGRRQKTARTENAKSEIARLSAEVTALKVGILCPTIRPDMSAKIVKYGRNLT